ncbi:MAG: imidazolonepropionase [Rickettsiales bacterium]|nr:imidazolonepropionase [Rickettsiales bacterium]
MTNPESVETLFTHATLATMAGDAAYGLLRDAAIGVTQGKIVWIGDVAEAPPAQQVEDCAGKLITPALIDCHTHLVHGGNRAKEFELRLNGASYEEIARSGGGILSTVTKTRAASEDELVATALKRLDPLIAEGLGTIEIKSGYGLETQSELKMLRAARRLAKERRVRVKTTFLGAHALPPEFADRADDYIRFVCDEMLPAAHAEGLVDAVDGFCENIAFSPAQMERVFAKAQELGLPIKLHAEQLSDLGGAVMAAGKGALSVDHLEYLKPEDASILAENNTVAVLLPGAFYTLRETKLPPIEALRKAGVSLAIATDNNPGSSPISSLLLTMNMACTLFRLTPEEALAGCTRAAAQALGLQDEIGTLQVGKNAELAIWDVSEPAELIYPLGGSSLVKRVIGENR